MREQKTLGQVGLPLEAQRSRLPAYPQALAPEKEPERKPQEPTPQEPKAQGQKPVALEPLQRKLDEPAAANFLPQGDEAT